MPEVKSITFNPGIAGQFAYGVVVDYPESGVEFVQFVGSTYGGPIVMVFTSGQAFISKDVTDRIGNVLTPDWIRRFFGEKEN